MKYFIDTEFLEGVQTKRFLGINYGNTKPTIDLISIGIVSEDGREYYSISKDFNLYEAWNRFDLKDTSPAKKYMGIFEEREYWIRDNVLKPIFRELFIKSEDDWLAHTSKYEYDCFMSHVNAGMHDDKFTLKVMKNLLNKYGKSNSQIAEEIKEFCKSGVIGLDDKAPNMIWPGGQLVVRNKPEFYGYYADYDWVVFCWLFGKMMDLPNGFPMYCIDLKQEMDRLGLTKEWKKENCPDPVGEHNALVDARWNKLLRDKIQSIG